MACCSFYISTCCFTLHFYVWKLLFFLNLMNWEFSGSPVVGTMWFYCWALGAGLIPGWGNRVFVGDVAYKQTKKLYEPTSVKGFKLLFCVSSPLSTFTELKTVKSLLWIRLWHKEMLWLVWSSVHIHWSFLHVVNKAVSLWFVYSLEALNFLQEYFLHLQYD